MNKDKQNKAEVLVQKAIYDLQEAANILKMEEQNDGFYILDLKNKTVIGERPTFLTAKSYAIDYIELNKGAEAVICKHESIVNK